MYYLLVILLKKTPYLSPSIRSNKNAVLTGTMRNNIHPNSISRLTDINDTMFSILNQKLVDPVVFLLS